LLPLLLVAHSAVAATVQGFIFDDETQNPLARTHVTLMPLPGSKAAPVSLLANDKGLYAFSGVQPGWYVIRASRTGYETTEWGQLRPGLPGAPLQIRDGNPGDDSNLHQIVMHRQAAIVGSVVDDNQIGIPAWPVEVYTARRPIRRVTQTITDDRGNFRAGELEPGTYIVRSGAGALDETTTLVSSYYKYGTAVSDAEPIRLHVAETQSYAVVHTTEGSLFELTGELIAPDRLPVRLTLITDTGRRVIASGAGPFTAARIPPGTVELVAEGAGCGNYQTLTVDRNMFASITCLPLAAPVVSGAGSFALRARRLDLDGPGVESQTLSPGRWEFTLTPDSRHYLVSIQNDGETARPPMLDGWFEVNIGNAPRLRVNLSDKPASITGTVTLDGKPVIGAPVFLQLINPDLPEQALQSWEIRADAIGHFEIFSLGPGSYRLMSSYEMTFDDPRARSAAVNLTLSEGESATQTIETLRQ
jgi:hypothetical protein